MVRSRRTFTRTSQAFITFLPEILLAASSTELVETLGAQKISLDIDGMGCEACELYVAFFEILIRLLQVASSCPLEKCI
jgi:hypothetical protein